MNSLPPISLIIDTLKNKHTEQPTHEQKNDNPSLQSTALVVALNNIERCIIGRPKRSGFFGKCASLIYRIWNAVKSIFGQSDWQKARRGIKTFGQTLIKQLDITSIKPDSLNDEVCDHILRYGVEFNENEAIKVVAYRLNRLYLDDSSRKKLLKGLLREGPSYMKDTFYKNIEFILKLEMDKLPKEEGSRLKTSWDTFSKKY